MHEERFGGRMESLPPIVRARHAFFLLARPTQMTDRLPPNIGEYDVFFSEEQALDALDIHYAWCKTNMPHPGVVESAQWYLQSAMVGPRLTPSLGEVYLATTEPETGETGTHETWAAAGGFLTEGEVVHWAPFIKAVQPRIRAAGGPTLELAYRGDADVHFHQVWFTPLHSLRVYPHDIMVDEDSPG